VEVRELAACGEEVEDTTSASDVEVGLEGGVAVVAVGGCAQGQENC